MISDHKSVGLELLVNLSSDSKMLGENFLHPLSIDVMVEIDYTLVSGD